jgi:hypothetical protein
MVEYDIFPIGLIWLKFRPLAIAGKQGDLVIGRVAYERAHQVFSSIVTCNPEDDKGASLSPHVDDLGILPHGCTFEQGDRADGHLL